MRRWHHYGLQGSRRQLTRPCGRKGGPGGGAAAERSEATSCGSPLARGTPRRGGPRVEKWVRGVRPAWAHLGRPGTCGQRFASAVTANVCAVIGRPRSQELSEEFFPKWQT